MIAARSPRPAGQAAPARRPASPRAASPRVANIGRIHAAKKRLALTEDCYRLRLGRLTGGTESLREMTDEQIALVAADLGRLSTRPAAPLLPHIAKVKALWIALRHLGLLRDPSDAALSAFVRRQTRTVTPHGQGLDDLRWLSARDADLVIEALKKWAARDAEHGGAGVLWAEHPKQPQRAVVEAQWRLLLQAGAIRQPDWLDPASFGYRVCGRPAGFQFYRREDWDQLIKALGGMVRKALAKRGSTTVSTGGEQA